LLDKTGIPYWATVPIAGAICLGAGFLFGLPALRLEGLYLALATFALAVATPQILKFKGFDHWTGGVQGIQVDAPAAPFGLPLNTDRWIYYFCLIWTIALFIIARNLLRGRAIIAIRDHPLAAATMGVDTALYKSLTFGVSASTPALPARWARCCRPMSRRTASPSFFRSNSWSAASSAGSSRFRVPSSGHSSSSSCPISLIRYRRRRPMPFSAFF
jgi:branched-subunit amino acid ABC-type transport system permease component